MDSPPINGLTDLIRVVEDLSRRMRVVESGRSRTLSFGDSGRLEIQGFDAAAALHFIRTFDGNDWNLTP